MARVTTSTDSQGISRQAWLAVSPGGAVQWVPVTIYGDCCGQVYVSQHSIFPIMRHGVSRVVFFSLFESTLQDGLACEWMISSSGYLPKECPGWFAPSALEGPAQTKHDNGDHG